MIISVVTITIAWVMKWIIMQIKDFFSLFLLIVHKRLHFLNTHIIFIIMYLSENPNIMVSSAHEIWVIFGVSFGIP